jgi:hypothetical protein
MDYRLRGRIAFLLSIFEGLLSIANRPQNRTEIRPKRWQPCHKETCQGGSRKRGYPTRAFTVAVCTAIDGYRKRRFLQINTGRGNTLFLLPEDAEKNTKNAFSLTQDIPQVAITMDYRHHSIADK